MAQEFVIKSDIIEDKINQLLPSQGGFQPGVDFSASTMIIPVVDVTEAAEGSVLRQDLQTALSHATATSYDVSNATTTVINTTGYWRIIGAVQNYMFSIGNGKIQINDGTTTKIVFATRNTSSGSDTFLSLRYDFIVKLEAGDSLEVSSDHARCILTGSVRQLADLNGNLTNP